MRSAKKYSIYVNDYSKSTVIENKIRAFMGSCHLRYETSDIWEYNKHHPDLVFCIGGDGVILRAIHDLQAWTDNVKIVSVKSGALGFYSTFTIDNILQFLPQIINNEYGVQDHPLLKITTCDQKKFYALNEIKLMDHIKMIRGKMYVNDDYLQYFRGSGLIFATASGSTGYMKAINGAIILANTPLWEVKELAPVNNSVFSTINTPLILDRTKKMSIEGELRGKWLIVDTFGYEMKCDKVTVTLSKVAAHMIFHVNHAFNLVSRLKNIFSLHGDQHQSNSLPKSDINKNNFHDHKN